MAYDSGLYARIGHNRKILKDPPPVDTRPKRTGADYLNEAEIERILRKDNRTANDGVEEELDHLFPPDKQKNFLEPLEEN